MEPFLRRFFPHVLRRMAAAKGNEYCLYDSQTLTAFTSSLYVAGRWAGRPSCSWAARSSSPAAP